MVRPHVPGRALRSTTSAARLVPPSLRGAMALISLEDLDGLDDEPIDDDITDNSEPMEENERERLFNHWQSVASTHHVSVPTEMTEPIQEMTRRNQQREQVPFSTISCHEKLGETLYEDRMYPAGKWACVTRGEKLYEQSISMAFMKLMRFICKENSAGRYLGVTIPIVNNISMSEDRKTLEKDILTAYYLPAEFQVTPLQPTDADITIVHRGAFRVFARAFFGTTTEETVSHQISILWDILDHREELRREELHRDHYMVAVYENPGVACRRNEIWFIRREP